MNIPVIIYLPYSQYFTACARTIITGKGLTADVDLVLLGPDIPFNKVLTYISPEQPQLFASMQPRTFETGLGWGHDTRNTESNAEVVFGSVLAKNPQAILVGCSEQENDWMKSRYGVHHEAHYRPEKARTDPDENFAHELLRLIGLFREGKLTQ